MNMNVKCKKCVKIVIFFKEEMFFIEDKAANNQSLLDSINP
jgi:hypothetical protein